MFIEKKKVLFSKREKSAEDRNNFISTLFSNLFDKDDKSSDKSTVT